MKEEIIGKRYARALIQLGKEADALEAIRKDLTEVVNLFRESELFRRVMCDPVYEKRSRKEILGQVMQRLGTSSICQRFLYLLIDTERIRYVSAMLDAYTKLEDEAAGRLRARILSAYPLSEGNLNGIRGGLEKKLAKEVILETEIDPELIGGVVCRVNGMVFDGSVKTQVQTLKEALRGE